MKNPSTILGVILLSAVVAEIFGADLAGVWTGRIIFRMPDGDMPRDVTLKLKTTGSSATGLFLPDRRCNAIRRRRK